MNLEYVGHGNGERLRCSDLKVGMEVCIVDFDDNYDSGFEREEFENKITFPVRLIVDEIRGDDVVRYKPIGNPFAWGKKWGEGTGELYIHLDEEDLERYIFVRD